MKRLLLIGLVITIYILHQDFWFWRVARPFVFGFLPVGLFYHICYTLAVAAVMWVLVRHAWPSHLEQEVESPPAARPVEIRQLRPEARS
ncbi:MAG TPA: hypothetical protein VJ302_19445 [Blastocatellia bacterium]|nr:hypothetical protein [Blastocatellia bacterium]